MEIIEYLLSGDLTWQTLSVVLVVLLGFGVYMFFKRYFKQQEVTDNRFNKLFERVITVQESQNLMLAVHENELKHIKEWQREMREDFKQSRK